MFAVTLLIYGLATGASALVGGLAALIALRVIVGLGLGAELPVASTYVSEFAPARMRGRLIVILEAFWAVGWTAAALIGYLVIPNVADGWRWRLRPRRDPRGVRPRRALGSSRIGALARSAGSARRGGSGRGAVRDGGAARHVAASPPQRSVEPVAQAAPAATPVRLSAGERLRTLWAPEFRVRTAALWIVWFCVNFAYYGAFIWIPSILSRRATTSSSRSGSPC